MKKLLIVLLALVFVLPVLAQEEHKEHMEHDMTMPAPLSQHDFLKKLEGEWEGWSESPMGKSKDWEKVHFGLNGQMMFRTAKSVMGDMVYEGKGGMTLHPETEELMGYWMDSFRGMYEGKGKIDGKTIALEWKGYQGSYTQTITMVNDDKYTFTYSFTDPEGNTQEGTGEMTRVKDMTDKS